MVRANGDTLRGEIENGFWVEPPKLIHFRRTATSPAELLRPRQRRAVLFAQGQYFRYETLTGTFFPAPFADVGWRARRVTVSLNAVVFDAIHDVRLGVAYRLDHSPDVARRGSASGK